LDLLAKCRLGDSETFGGAPEVQFLGNRDEIPEVAKLNPSSCADPNFALHIVQFCRITRPDLYGAFDVK
jgi:hypothetical protein